MGPIRTASSAGPKRVPFLGNVFQMPSSRLWEKAMEWKKKYGDLIYLENFGKPMLIINSYEIATELLDQKSAIYSSRPHLVMAGDVEGWGWNTLIAPYGERLRKARTFQHRFFNSPETLYFLGAQQSEARRTIKNILAKPESYAEAIHLLTGSLVLLNVYGHRVSAKDRFIELGVNAVKFIAETEQYPLLEIFSFLKYIPDLLPWTNIHEVAKAARRVSNAIRHEPHEATKEKMADGTVKECMTAILLTDNTQEDGSVTDEEDIRVAAATMFIGGVHTTSTTIMTFVLGMLKNPGAQRRGQAEVDGVVGAERLPTFEDKERMPYVHAILEESLRYASVAPLGFPHCTTEDDVYRGYHIPAGTTVIANQWGMSYDPKIHEDALAFKPERWLNKRDGGEGREPLPHNYSFGFGRRACVGQKWAEHLLFITIATMLAVVNFGKAVGEDGKPIEPNDQYEPGFARSLGPSECTMKPRSERVASLLESSVFADFGAENL